MQLTPHHREKMKFPPLSSSKKQIKDKNILKNTKKDKNSIDNTQKMWYIIIVSN
jgi:hypothetical protein